MPPAPRFSRFSRLSAVLFALLAVFAQPAALQAALNPGDIAFVMYNADATPDTIAFVALVPIPEGEEIKFTDNGWLAAGSFRTGEGTFTYTAPVGGISIGSVITVTLSGPTLATQGDQIIAFQGTSTVLAALNNEGAGVWQSDATNSNTSALPSGLVDGTTAVALNEIDNAIYTGSLVGTKEELLSLINNRSNWTTDDAAFFTWTAGNFTVNASGVSPSLSIGGSLLPFSSIAGAPSASQTLTVNGTNLEADILVVAPANFEVSTNNSSFSSNATVAQSGGTAGSPVYVRLSATAAQGAVSGNLTISSTNATTRTVPVSGSVRPSVVAIPFGPQTFATDSEPFFTYSAAGSKNWTRVTSSITGSPDAVMEINGFGSDVVADDWLIIGPFDFSAATNPGIIFNTVNRFTSAGTIVNELSLKLSTNYTGTGDPSTALWTTLPFQKPAAEVTKSTSGLVPLTGSAGQTGVYVAFHYVAAGTASGTTALWQVDDVNIGDNLTPPATPPAITTNGTLTPFSTTNGTASASQSFTVNGTDLTADITAVAPASFEVSIDNSTFGPNATLTQSGGNASGSISVRLAASAPVGTPAGNITLSSTGAANRLVAVSGNVTAPLSGVPVVTAASFNGTVGEAFSANISATNGPNTFSASPALPAGLTLNASTGAISGSPTAAGNSSVLISATNGVGSGNASFTFTIAKGTPTITTPPTATPIRVGQTLSNSTLSGGVASVNGTFAFTDPTIAPVATGNQSVSFTPTDSANWNTATTNVGVTVNPAPTINVNPTSLTGFSTKQNAASANQTVTVNGTNLEGLVTINASAGYQISTDGVSYSSSLTLSPSQASPVARAATIIASDTASNYGTPASNTWGNGSNAGTGFQPWLFNVVNNSTGTPPPAFYAGAFIGDPISAGITSMPAPAFGLYANPGGTAATATVSRAFAQPMAVGDSFSFQWATNWDSDVGNKGFNIFAGGNQVVNVNQAGFPGNITLNGELAIDGNSGFGTQPMTWTFTRTTATNLLVTSTPRSGGSTIAYSTNVTISAAPEGFSFYTTAMGQGDQRQPYFNNLQISSSGGSSGGGNLTNTTVYVRLAANGLPGAANGNLTLTSANATTRTVTLSGTVIALATPGITSRTINGTVGSNLTASINATNSPTSHTANGTLPPGITFNATTGIFSGTPTTAGNYVVAVTATNIDGTGSGNFTFAIAKGTPTIITPPTASLIYSGQQLSVSSLSGGVASIPGNFSFTSPSLIPPVGNATQSVTFRPADAANWNDLTLNVPVQVSPDPPGPPSVSDATFAGSVGANLTVSINATNGPISHNATTALPLGLSLDSVTGAITGIPQVVGNYTVSVTATNIKGTGSGNITFVIGKGTPTVLTAPTARVYTDETLGTAYSPLSGQMNTVGNFVFVDPSLSFPNSANTTQTVSVLFTPVDLVNWIATTVNATVAVDSLPDNGPLTITAQVTQLREGDEYSESRIRIRRPGPLSSNATINLSELPSGQLQGDITGDVNFLNLPSQVVIPAGSNSTVFYVIAKNDTVYTGNRSVVLSVTSRFHGPTAQSVTLNIIEDETSPAPGFASWSNNATRTPALIRDYAIGGAAMGQRGELPSLSMNSTHAALDAVIRTQDPKLTVLGEWTADLKNGPWTPVNLSLHSNQTGLSTGFQRRFFSIPVQPGETRKFLRLRVELSE